MNDFTKGEWDSDKNEVYINDGINGGTRISALVEGYEGAHNPVTAEEVDATAAMFAAAATAATALDRLGYDAIEVFKALPELIASFGFANTDDLLRRIKGE